MNFSVGVSIYSENVTSYWYFLRANQLIRRVVRSIFSFLSFSFLFVGSGSWVRRGRGEGRTVARGKKRVV